MSGGKKRHPYAVSGEYLEPRRQKEWSDVNEDFDDEGNEVLTRKGNFYMIFNDSVCKNPPAFDKKNLSTDKLKHLLATMLRIRTFEQCIADRVENNQIITPCHLYIGQEAVATGVCTALKDEDYIFGTHRSHGHYLAKGGDLNRAMAEIHGRATGCSHGRGGSMHLCDPSKGILGTSSIVAGSVPQGIGAALAEKIRGTGHISVIFHGDGVPEEGVWNESANFAAINKLPVLFVCENNLYCTHLPLEKRRTADNLPELAKAHGIPSRTIDGNNVLEVYDTAQTVVEEIRNGSGPQFIECRTYRWLGHVGPKDNLEVGLRSKEEVEYWKSRCPIKTYEDYLTASSQLNSAEVETLHAQASKQVQDSLAFALESPYPAEEELLKHVYKE